MNPAHFILPIAFVLVEVAWAEPVKCVIDGKTLYTDDASRCDQVGVKGIKNNVSVFPKIGPGIGASGIAKPSELPTESISESILGHFGMSQEDVANGWKTIMDAKKRGSWKAPDMPDAQ